MRESLRAPNLVQEF